MSQQLPAYMMNRAPTAARGIGQQAAAGVASSQPAHISIAGNVFTRVDSAGNKMPILVQFQNQMGQLQTINAPTIRVIVIGANPNQSKVFYEGAYDPNSSDPPACFSDNGVGPSAQASKPQSASCSLCPHNAWGSRINQQTGGQGKACSDKKKLAVRLAPEYQDDTIYQLQIPPASLKAMSAYMHWTGQQDFGGRKADVSDLITEIGFEQGKVGTLTFNPGGFYDDQTYNWIEQALASQADKIAWVTGVNDQPRQAALQGPQGAAVMSPAPVAQQIAYQPPAGTTPMLTPPQPGQPMQPVAQPVQAQPVAQAPAPKTRRTRAPRQEQQTPPAGPAFAQAQPVTTPVAVPVGTPTGPAAPMSSPPVFLQPASQPQTNFGMQANPPAPSDDIAAKIEAAMKIGS